MLAVELLILLVGMAGTQELQVRLADDVGTYIAQQTLDGGLLVYGVGVLAGFVITVETTNPVSYTPLTLPTKRKG